MAYKRRLGVVGWWSLYLAIALHPASGLADNQPKHELVYFGSQQDKALLGVGQGLEDASRRKASAANEYRLRIIAPDSIRPIDDPRPVAIFAAADAESLRLLSEFNPGVPVFNLIEELDDLRALCLPNLFHIMPSQRMRADAVAQWREQHPGGTPVALAWHDKLAQADARNLNQRFYSKRQFALDDQAWTGWAAAKMLVESIGADASDNTDLVGYMQNRLTFNGYKGAPMSFRPNGQLRQPLLLVKDGRVLGTVPPRGETSRAALDSLGYGECP